MKHVYRHTETNGGMQMWVDDLVKESKKLIRKGKKLVRSFPREDQELIGLLAAKLVGDKVNEIYETRTPEGKALWETIRPIHHGDVGYVLAEDGKKRRDPLLVGAGKGLMLSDIKDRDKWVYPKMKSVKKRKSQKRR
jgi:hypothetical protein